MLTSVTAAFLSGTAGTLPGADLEATCIASACRTW